MARKITRRRGNRDERSMREVMRLSRALRAAIREMYFASKGTPEQWRGRCFVEVDERRECLRLRCRGKFVQDD